MQSRKKRSHRMRRRYFLRRWLPTILWSVVLMALVALVLVGIYSLVQWDKVRNNPIPLTEDNHGYIYHNLYGRAF